MHIGTNIIYKNRKHLDGNIDNDLHKEYTNTSI